jgi:hypothetical protein
MTDQRRLRGQYVLDHDVGREVEVDMEQIAPHRICRRWCDDRHGADRTDPELRRNLRLSTVVCAPVSTMAVTETGAPNVPPSPTASINAREGPIRTGSAGPEATRSAKAYVKEGNYTPTLNEVKFNGTSIGTICFTRKASFPNCR